MISSFTFTTKYISALIILGLLSVYSYVNLTTLIQQQTNDSKVINLSGKQRMLSQRIKNTTSTFDLIILKKSLKLMKDSHLYLTSLPMSKNVKNIYFEEPLFFDKKVKNYLEHANNVKKNTVDINSKYVIEQSNKILKVFDDLTYLYQHESEHKIKNMQEHALYILILLISTLFSIGFFIFRPTSRELEYNTQKIISEKNYSDAIIESNTNAIIAVGKDFKIRTFNKAAETMFEYTKEEMIGKDTLLKIIPKIYHKAHERGITNHFKNGTLKHNGAILELTAMKKNGEIFPIRISFGENKSTIDEKRLVIANIQDNTIGKEKEKLLIANEKIYKDLFVLNNSIIILVDPLYGNIVNINKNALDFYGYEESKFLTMNVSNIDISSMDKIQEFIDLSMNNKQSNFQSIHKLHNDEQRYVKVHSTPTMYNNEIVLYVTIIDITEEIMVKDKLTTLKEEFNNFFELSINIHLISTDSGTIIQMNKACQKLLGYTYDELINHSFLNFVHPDDIKKTVNEMKKLNRGETIYYFENRYKHKNGHYLNLAWSANFANNLIYASAQDITSLKVMEKERNKQEQILFQQSKMAAMGEMIENIAHQWRQPLSAISVVSSGLKIKDEMNMLKNTDIKIGTDQIIDAVEHLSQTIDDFRDFYKIDKQKQSFNINEVIDKAFKLITSQFKSTNITILKNIKEGTIVGYKNELIQVLINILNNARDELISNNQSLKLIIIETVVNNGILEIYIKDNAGGIPEEIINNIFLSHFTTKEDSGGTGIGLYMSKMILEEHLQGKIEVENINFMHEKDSCTGAQFKLSLPIVNDE